MLLKLLGRSGTGQRLTTYTTVISGPRREGEEDGPDELHVVILDNGRTKLVGGRYREMLACIRCGACLNVCPVYRRTGGAAYGPVYSGPMGAVLVPLLAELERAPDLPHASSLCGACTDACPVKIPLHELLLELRNDLVETMSRRGGSGSRSGSGRMHGRRRSAIASRHALARLGQPLAGVAGPGRTWRKGRGLPKLGRRFRDRR